MAEGNQVVRVKDSIWTLLSEPGLKRRFVRVNRSAALSTGCLRYRDQLSTSCLFPRQQDSALLEQLTKSSYTVGLVVLMPLNAVSWDDSILLVDIPTGEDMGRGEGRGRRHAVEQ
jgi:hypothetical protein